MFKILSQISKLKLFLLNFTVLTHILVSLVTPTMILVIGKIDITNQTVVLLFGLAFFFLYVLNYLILYVFNYIAHSIGKDYIIKISNKTIKCFYDRNLNYSSDWLNSFLSQDMEIFYGQYLIPVLFIFTDIIKTFIISGYILFINFSAGIFFVLCSFLIFVPQIMFKNILKDIGEKFEKTREISLATISDFSRGVNTIQSNKSGKPFIKWVFSIMKDNKNATFEYYSKQYLSRLYSGPFTGLGYIIPIVIALWTISNTNLSIPTIIALLTASEMLANNLKTIYSRFNYMHSCLSIKNKMLEIINMTDQEIESPNNLVVTNSLNININNLNKNYDDKVIFSNASAKIAAGDKVLLSGVSGSGKTTLFSLLCGQDKDYSGTIYFENEKGEKYIPSYDNVSLIHQTPYIFSATLKENITLFEEYSDEEVIEVLKRVHLWDELGRDLNAQLNGSNLSGGQVMKIEIARCFLRLRPIVLADEVTAALDKENAKEIRELLHTLDTTLIEIAHKYNIEDYNYVYKLENNQLVKQVV